MVTQEVMGMTKKRKIFKIVSIVILSLIIIVGGVVFWFIKNGTAGLFKDSGLLKILGINKQIQLEETEEISLDENTVTEKLGYNIEEYEREDLKKRKSLSIELNSKEAAYLISKMQKEDSMKNVQVKIDDEDNLLLSAIVNVENMTEAFGADIAMIEDLIGELPDEVPLYAELEFDSESNTASLNDIKVGKIGIPNIISSQMDDYIDSGVEEFFENILGIEIDDISISDGNLNIEGVFPAP